MRTIMKKVGIAKTTIIERLSGRRQGSGHIVGGKWKARILMKGKQAGHQVGHINHFNWTSKQVFQVGSLFGSLYHWPAWWYNLIAFILDQNKKMTFTMWWFNLHGEASHSQTTSYVY